MKVYRSVIDWWLLAVVFIPIISILVFSIYDSKPEAMLTVLPVFVFVIYIFTSVKYVINEGVLHVKAGILVNQNINIADIKSVRKSNNPLSSPALSLKRLEVKYGSNAGYTLISPKNRQQFINDLLLVNPDITVNI